VTHLKIKNSVHGTIFFLFSRSNIPNKIIRLQKVVKNSPAIAVLAPRTLLSKGSFFNKFELKTLNSLVSAFGQFGAHFSKNLK
jgi:hypothetical protein